MTDAGNISCGLGVPATTGDMVGALSSEANRVLGVLILFRRGLVRMPQRTVPIYYVKTASKARLLATRCRPMCRLTRCFEAGCVELAFTQVCAFIVVLTQEGRRSNSGEESGMK